MAPYYCRANKDCLGKTPQTLFLAADYEKSTAALGNTVVMRPIAILYTTTIHPTQYNMT